MSNFSFFWKKKKFSLIPLWSIEINGIALSYNGEDVPAFLQEFERLEDNIIRQWNNNTLNWNDYRRMIVEVQEAKQMFVRFVYH